MKAEVESIAALIITFKCLRNWGKSSSPYTEASLNNALEKVRSENHINVKNVSNCQSKRFKKEGVVKAINFLVLLIAVLVLNSCESNKGTEPNTPAEKATADDYVGIWSGMVIGKTVCAEDSDTTEGAITWTMTDSTLSGTSTMAIDTLRSVIVEDGILTCDWPLADPWDVNNPDCARWEVTFSATLNANRTIMTGTFIGIFCGGNGGCNGSYTGTFNKE